MVAVTFTLCGLLFGLVGVFILAIGEVSQQAAFVRYTRADASEKTAWNSEVARYPWWARPLIRFVICFGAIIGSKNPEDMGDAELLEGLATRLLGYVIIFLGFLFQALGALATVW